MLAPTGGVIAFFDKAVTGWRKIVAITVGVVIPGAAILLFIALIAALDQLE